VIFGCEIISRAGNFRVPALHECKTGATVALQKAATAARIGKLATHTMRHTFRSCLDSVGTPVGVQQKLMRRRHRTTMHYGDAFTEDMTAASGKIASLALNSRVIGRRTL